MAAAILSKRNSGSGWLLVAENVRQQEELAAEIESWGQDAVVLVVSVVHRATRQAGRPYRQFL